ncbi:MAG: STAS domain-containing protein [Oscillospiraceae bacterium]|nr:STAS domain-containing protein [Oscillospiraceae bacterium]
MAVYTQEENGVLTARLTDEIDHHTARWLRADLDTAIQDTKPQILRLDFGGVSFMDSSGIGLVMGRYKNMQARNGKVELVNLPEYIEKVMLLAGVNRLATIKKE